MIYIVISLFKGIHETQRCNKMHPISFQKTIRFQKTIPVQKSRCVSLGTSGQQ